jgi:hypothetical protein
MKTLPPILIMLLILPILLVLTLILSLVMLFSTKSKKSYRYLTYNSDEEDMVESICWDEIEDETLPNVIGAPREVYHGEPKLARDSSRPNFKYSIN